MAIPSWQQAPSAWDRVKLGLDWLPGPCNVTISGYVTGLDIRKAPKTDRAALVDQGDEPVQGTIELTIGFESYTSPYGTPSQQWESWLTIFEKIRPKKGSKNQALAISHPQFQMAGITQVYIKSISGLKGNGPGVRRISIDVVELAPILKPVASGTVGAAQKVKVPGLSTLTKAPDPATGNAGP